MAGSRGFPRHLPLYQTPPEFQKVAPRNFAAFFAKGEANKATNFLRCREAALLKFRMRPIAQGHVAIKRQKTRRETS
jgi:hypothetical protein